MQQQLQMKEIRTISAVTSVDFDEQYNTAMQAGFVPMGPAFLWGERLAQQLVLVEEPKITGVTL